MLCNYLPISGIQLDQRTSCSNPSVTQQGILILSVFQMLSVLTSAGDFSAKSCPIGQFLALMCKLEAHKDLPVNKIIHSTTHDCVFAQMMRPENTVKISISLLLSRSG